MFIPDPDLDFLGTAPVPIPDHGVKKAPDPGSATLDTTTEVLELAASQLTGPPCPRKLLGWLMDGQPSY